MFKQYINGSMVKGSCDEQVIINPATEETAGTFSGADANQGREALDSANEAFAYWSALSLNQRAKWVTDLAFAIEQERDQLLEILMSETGKPFSNAMYDFTMLLDCLRYFMEEAKRLTESIIPDYDNQFRNLIIRQPLGVVVGYLAWNFPLLNLGYKLGPILASGCTCVLKPSSKTPLSTLVVGEIAYKIGFPSGVINIVAGSNRELTKELNESSIPKLITLIGSTETGKTIINQSSTSIKRYSLELGGNAPAVVMPDADIDDAARKLVDLKFTNSGQVCVSPNRVFVHESVHDSFISAVVKYAVQVKLGWGKEEGAMMGPLLTKNDRQRMHELVHNAVKSGAKLVYGGYEPTDRSCGFYFLPTILDNITEEMRVYREEIFGPIMPICTFKDKAEVIRKANDTQYGLAAYLFTSNMKDTFEISEALEFGSVSVNEPFYAYNLPHGGIKESGMGKDCSVFSLEEYYYIKRISIKV